MNAEVVDALLWLVAAAARHSRVGARVGHGYADADFRPAEAPFASIVGPLQVTWDAERDDKRPRFVTLQIPGMWRGAPAAGAVPAGNVEVRVDGTARAVVAHGVGSFANDAAARALAASIEVALRAAVWDEGGPVTDPDRQAELARVSCRWDSVNRSLVLASGRAGPIDDPVRTPVAPVVETPPGAQPAALDTRGATTDPATTRALASAIEVLAAGPALGLLAGRSLPSRIVRQQRPPVRAVNLDARVDLWAGSQPELGELVDVLYLSVPSRGALATRPGLLAEDVPAGAKTLRLLDQGTPTSPWTLAHLEAGDGGVDRALGVPWVGAGADPAGVVLAAGGVARIRAWLPPIFEDPRVDRNPFEGGLAVTVGFTFAPDFVGGSFDLLSVGSAVTLSVTLDANKVTVAAVVRFEGGTIRMFGKRVDYTVPDVGGLPAARVLAATTPIYVHLRSNPATGAVALFVEPAEEVSHSVTPVPSLPLPVWSAPLGTFDLEIELGAPAGAGVTVWHVHVSRTPVGAPGWGSRRLVWGASRRLTGESLHLADTRDGAIPTGRRFDARIRSVVGGVVELDRPTTEAWPKRTTLVHGEELFFQQLRLSRKDDLLNHLFRVSIDYRVSAWLEERLPETSPVLVLEPRLRVNDPDPVDTIAATGVPLLVPPS